MSQIYKVENKLISSVPKHNIFKIIFFNIMKKHNIFRNGGSMIYDSGPIIDMFEQIK